MELSKYATLRLCEDDFYQGSPKEDLTGKVFNGIEVLSYYGTRKGTYMPHYLCKCSCGRLTIIQGSCLKRLKTKSCGCLNKRNLKGKDNPSWRGYGDISGSAWKHIALAAKIKNREINIDIVYIWDLFLKQNRKCALTGIDLKIDTGDKNRDGNASLDRIDSSKGYIIGNVQWVHKDINYMKQEYSDNYFIEMCKKVSEHNKV